MQKNKTVTINGRLYDAVTGMPVTTEPVEKKLATKKTPVSSAGVHLAPQRSQTLNRRVAKKQHTPAPAKPTHLGRVMDIARSSRISRFAPHPVVEAKPEPEPVKDRAPVSHPMVHRALLRPASRQKQIPAPVKATIKPRTSKDVKDEAIANALAAPSNKKTQQKKPSFFNRHARKLTVITIALIVVLVGGYLTLVNMPGLSVSFAASQAGIKATYPSYLPDGYSLTQPVTFGDGVVTMNFGSNSGGAGYTIKEARSSWDSSAVLENVVKKQVNNNYITTQDSGLTIYTYDGNAAWVNAGILYTITGNAPLSNEQVRNIATSL